MFELLKPIIIFLVVSTSIALLKSDTLFDFIKYFIFASVCQFFIGLIYKNILQLFAERIKNERIKEFSKQGMEIVCPCYLEKKFLLPLDLNGSNNFNCAECNKGFSVDISARTFLQTEPVDIKKAEADFVEVINKIQNYK